MVDASVVGTIRLIQQALGMMSAFCVHAEQNALIAAARFGNPIEGAIVYSTMRPCFDCTKAMLQARVQAIYYIHDWQHPIKALHEQYEEIQKRLGVHQLKIADPDEKWANTREAQPPSNPREVMGNESLIISATPDGVGVMSQRL